MDFIIVFFTSHAPHAHWIIFSLILLAGFNFPISEDLLIITSAILASTVVPANTIKLYGFLVIACFLADIICFSIGRFLADKLGKISWLSSLISTKRIEKAQNFYRRHGIYTLIIGRFIPFGVRNALFLSAGISKMGFIRFISSDAIACLLSTSTLFSITYTLGKNYHEIFFYLKAFKLGIFSLFSLLVLFLILLYKKRKRSSKMKKNIEIEES